MICLSNYLHKSVKIQTSCMAKWFHKKELQGLTFKYNFAYWSKMKLWFVFISLNQAQFHKINCFEHFFTNWSCSTTNSIFSSHKQFWTNSGNSKIPLKMKNLQFLDCFLQSKCQSSLKFEFLMDSTFHILCYNSNMTKVCWAYSIQYMRWLDNNLIKKLT